MIKVGITGGIGAGKSFVSDILSKWGHPVFNSDFEAKKIMANQPEVIQQIKDSFGEQAYIDNCINREFLAHQIFNHPSSKTKLNNIVHPAVIKAFDEWCLEIAKDQGIKIVFNEAAILFETGRYKDFDFTLLVTATESVRIERILKRDKSTIEEIKSRMNNQWSDDKKIPLASFVINNDGEAEIIPQLEDILKQIKIKSLKK